MSIDLKIIETVRHLRSDDLTKLLADRAAEDRALRALLAAARRRERAEREHRQLENAEGKR